MIRWGMEMGLSLERATLFLLPISNPLVTLSLICLRVVHVRGSLLCYLDCINLAVLGSDIASDQPHARRSYATRIRQELSQRRSTYERYGALTPVS